jgi:hypothetical protein
MDIDPGVGEQFLVPGGVPSSQSATPSHAQIVAFRQHAPASRISIASSPFFTVASSGRALNNKHATEYRHLRTETVAR